MDITITAGGAITIIGADTTIMAGATIITGIGTTIMAGAITMVGITAKSCSAADRPSAPLT
jgi:hypothetical protein